MFIFIRQPIAGKVYSYTAKMLLQVFNILLPYHGVIGQAMNEQYGLLSPALIYVGNIAIARKRYVMCLVWICNQFENLLI